jgi:hypothetical protein
VRLGSTVISNSGFYDVHDFTISVEGQADRIVSERYSHLKLPLPLQKSDPLITVHNGEKKVFRRSPATDHSPCLSVMLRRRTEAMA